MPKEGTIQDFFVRLTANSINAASTIRIRRNGVNGALSVSTVANTSGSYEDTTNSEPISPNNNICVQTVPGAATGTMTISVFSVTYDDWTGTTSRLATGEFQSPVSTRYVVLRNTR